MRMLEKLLKDYDWGVCAYEQSLLLPRANRSRLPAHPASVIVFLFGYYIKDFTESNIARYAILDDYHAVIGARLACLQGLLRESFPGEEFVPYVDASPVNEVQAAVRAGLGERGENGLLLSPVYGSRCFIAELVTSLPLPVSTGRVKGLCTRCDACRRACPTGALGEAGVERDRCRAQITQKKGELTEWETEQVRAGGLAWGCDLCAETCPVNRTAQKSRVEEFYQNPVPVLTPDLISDLCKTKAYGWRGEAVLRRNLEILENK